MSLITDTAEWFKARDARIGRWYTDDHGRYAFRVHLNDTPVIVTAKKYLQDGKASFFTEKVVQRAIDQDAVILLRVADTGQWLVFDPATVQTAGTESVSEDERKRRGETWTDIHTDIAADFQQWIDGHATPDPPDSVRSEDVTAWGER